MPAELEKPVTVIERRPGWRAINVRELWQYRELLYFLTWRDVKVRYKQSLLGLAWAVIQPVMYMVVFTIVFGGMAGVSSDGVPYPLFSYTALLPWTFFATALSQAGNSVVASGALITKVYFPRLAVPIASIGAAAFDFFVSLSVLFGLMVYYQMNPQVGYAPVSFSTSMLLIFPLLLILALAALGVGTMLAALNVAYRDFKYTIPFMIQLWMFATPVIYMGSVTAPAVKRDPVKAEVVASNSDSSTPSDLVTSPEADTEAAVESKKGADGGWLSKEYLLNLNPMSGLIRAFRAAVLGRPIDWASLGYSTIVVVITFLFGCFYFHRVENTFADII